MTQVEAVLQFMKEEGSITSYEAFSELGCTRLSAQIYDLKRKGWQIGSEPIVKRNRYGRRIVFSRYFLEGQNERI